ncbi:hypothetical protein GALL_300440 [mine drainage metagenome]|uniref:EF hand n=1 Tax=mine drainage metagenome TaxID=410659 RepID=A0A1J5QWL5_9ZZZZ
MKAGMAGVAAAGVLALLLTGCGFQGRRPAVARRDALVYSPNAEPLTGGPLGRASCAVAEGRWFDRLAGGPAGQVSRERFLADARAQFARMDLNHDGMLTSAVLARYRAPYLPNGGVSDGGRGGLGGGADKADPVMSADSHLLFRVTLEDFLAQAEDVFERLDRQHAGALSRADAEAFCAQ